MVIDRLLSIVLSCIIGFHLLEVFPMLKNNRIFLLILTFFFLQGEKRDTPRISTKRRSVGRLCSFPSFYSPRSMTQPFPTPAPSDRYTRPDS